MTLFYTQQGAWRSAVPEHTGVTMHRGDVPGGRGTMASDIACAGQSAAQLLTFPRTWHPQV